MAQPLEVIGLTAFLVIVVIILAWIVRTKGLYAKLQHRIEGLCAGPHNITLYDSPYKNYPTYEGRGATWWDGDRRCTASCQQSPCTVWCR
jgi:hypothetical protein